MNLSDYAKGLGALYTRAVPHVSSATEAKVVASHIMGPELKPIYQDIVYSLGNRMPYWFVGILHYRENSTLSTRAYLGNGQLIIGTGRKSTIVPKDRGPFQTFAAGAVDAIRHLNLQDADDWAAADCLERCSIWNGLGYAQRNVVNPYLFAGTNVYVSGKFTSDGHYDPHVVDRELGVACILKALGIR